MTEPVPQLHESFSQPGAEPTAWSRVVGELESAEMFWLSTVRRDGRPHVTPLPAVWLDGRLHFCTGAQEQKARNLEANPQCVLTTGTNSYRSGLDVVVEGAAARLTDPDTLTRLAARWKAKIDWEFAVADGQFVDPAHNGRPALVFAVTPAKILAFGKAPYTLTRYLP